MIRYCNVFVVNLTWPGISLSLVNIHIADPSLLSLFVQNSLEWGNHIFEHAGFFFIGLRIMSYPFAAHLAEALSHKLDIFSSYQSLQVFFFIIIFLFCKSCVLISETCLYQKMSDIYLKCVWYKSDCNWGDIRLWSEEWDVGIRDRRWWLGGCKQTPISL